MKISIIIPAHNEEKVIADCIFALLNQPYKDKEIIVVDDGSTDGTYSLLRYICSPTNIKLFKKNFHSISKTRNFGAEQATGDILVFVDADEIVNKDFLKNIAKAYQEHNFKFTGINVLSRITNWISDCFAFERSQFPLTIPAGPTYINNYQDIPSFAFIFDKTFFKEVGGYDETIFYFEDAELTQKCFKKAPMFFDPNTMVYHQEPNTIKETFRQGCYKGKGAFLEYKKGNLSLLNLCANFFVLSVLPYLAVAFVSAIRDYLATKTMTSFYYNFIIKPIKSLGATYAILFYIVLFHLLNIQIDPTKNLTTL